MVFKQIFDSYHSMILLIQICLDLRVVTDSFKILRVWTNASLAGCTKVWHWDSFSLQQSRGFLCCCYAALPFIFTRWPCSFSSNLGLSHWQFHVDEGRPSSANLHQAWSIAHVSQSVHSTQYQHRNWLLTYQPTKGGSDLSLGHVA